MKIRKTLFIIPLAIFIGGCGFKNMIISDQKALENYGNWRSAELQRLQAQVAPYMGKKCQDEIRKVFGEPENFTIYPPGSKVKFDADEIWYYRIYRNRKRIGSYKIFFRESILIAVDVH